MTNSYLVGIDVGGSKSHVLIQASATQQIQRFELGGVNIHNLSVEMSQAHLQAIFQRLKQYLPPSSYITHLCVGVASNNTPKDQSVWFQLIQRTLIDLNIPIQTVILTPDTYIALRSGTTQISGMCLIVGTGTNCYGLSPTLHEYRAGDWGYLVGDQGSGYWIGRQIAQIAVQQMDGRISGDNMARAVLFHSRTNSLYTFLDWAYHPNSITRLASLSRLITHPDYRDLPQLNSILDHAANQLFKTVSTVHRRLKQPKPDQLVIVGGLMYSHSPLRRKLAALLSQHLPHLTLIHPDNPPAWGALQTALSHHSQSLYPHSVVVFSPSLK